MSGGGSRRRAARQRVAGVLVIALAAVVASCFVGRKSSDYECSTTEDCEAGRTCDRGFCVSSSSTIDASLCPAACNGGCDLAAKTCSMRCDQNNKCNNATCPSGYACTITCSGTNVCSGQICPAGAQSCDITCSTSNACGDSPMRLERRVRHHLHRHQRLPGPDLRRGRAVQRQVPGGQRLRHGELRLLVCMRRHLPHRGM